MDQRTGDADAEFGRYALPPTIEALRGLAGFMPANRVGLWGVSLIRRLCLAGRRPPFDVPLFGSQKARLHPDDNRCEKRAFAGVQLWDGPERARLDRLVAAHDGHEPFHFVDAGANVGLYTLSVRAACQAAGVTLKALAIEPDPVNLARLRFNLAASGAGEVVVAPVALAAEEGEVRMEASAGNRGERRVSESGTVPVPARTLLALVQELGMPRIEALKMDIEGMEETVLGRFFTDAPATLWPGTLVLETGRHGNAALLDLLRDAGYRVTLRRGLNTVLDLTRNEEWNRRHVQA